MMTLGKPCFYISTATSMMKRLWTVPLAHPNTVNSQAKAMKHIFFVQVNRV